MMHLTKKSAENLVAAELLIRNNYNAASVHCSYYSVFQLMSCIIVDKHPNGLDGLKSLTNGPNSHNKVFSFLKKSLFNDLRAANRFERKFKKLKKERKIADYEDQMIDNFLSETCYKNAEDLLTILKKVI